MFKVTFRAWKSASIHKARGTPTTYGLLLHLAMHVQRKETIYEVQASSTVLTCNKAFLISLQNLSVGFNSINDQLFNFSFKFSEAIKIRNEREKA
jgi:hypothetical protein